MNVVVTLIRHTRNHAGALVILCAPLAGSCVFQPIHDNASSGSQPVELPIEPGNVRDPGNGTIPEVTVTPPIYGFTLGGGYDGTQTDQACVHTSAQAITLLTGFCAPCHALGDASLGNPKFKDVLTITKLTDPTTPTDMPGVPFIVPGYPEKSRLFQRVWEGTMPNTIGTPEVRRKLNVSEVSVIENWISRCLGTKRPSSPPANASPTTGSATSSTAATGGPPSSGPTGAGGTGGAGGAPGAGGAAAGTGGSGSVPEPDAGAGGAAPGRDGGGAGGGMGGRRGGG